MKSKRPPLGIRPRFVWMQDRTQEIYDAIGRYMDEELEIPIEWINEYNENMRILRNSNNLTPYPQNKMQMDQLDLAIQYLKRRAVSTSKVKKKLMKQYIKVLSLNEVESVLELVKTGEFKNFHDHIKELVPNKNNW